MCLRRAGGGGAKAAREERRLEGGLSRMTEPFLERAGNERERDRVLSGKEGEAESFGEGKDWVERGRPEREGARVLFAGKSDKGRRKRRKQIWSEMPFQVGN